MIRTTRDVNECECQNCGIVHLLGETFQGRRCCDDPMPSITGKRTIVEYTKTNKEEKQEVLAQMRR